MDALTQPNMEAEPGGHAVGERVPHQQLDDWKMPPSILLAWWVEKGGNVR